LNAICLYYGIHGGPVSLGYLKQSIPNLDYVNSAS